jgi:hypothetical protein
MGAAYMQAKNVLEPMQLRNNIISTLGNSPFAKILELRNCTLIDTLADHHLTDKGVPDVEKVRNTLVQVCTRDA